MKPTLEKYWVISTKHISEADSALLKRHVLAGHMADHFEGYASFIHIVSDPRMFKAQVKQYKDMKVSKAFLNLIKAAHQGKVTLLSLDKDGEEIEGWPVYDW